MLHDVAEIINAARQSPLGIVALIISAIAILALVFFRREHANLKLAVLVLSIVSFFGVGMMLRAEPAQVSLSGNGPVAAVSQTIEGRGFYEDIVTLQNGIPTYRPAHEDIRLTLARDHTISGNSNGVVVSGQDQHVTNKQWQQSGYVVGEYLYMSYLTLRDEGQGSIPSGIGGYVLQKAGRNFIGHIIYWDSENKVTLDCPYVLTTVQREQQLSDEEAQKLWPFLHNQCLDVTFTGALHQPK
jgi:hypothetical protein